MFHTEIHLLSFLRSLFAPMLSSVNPGLGLCVTELLKVDHGLIISPNSNEQNQLLDQQYHSRALCGVSYRPLGPPDLGSYWQVQCNALPSL